MKTKFLSLILATSLVGVIGFSGCGGGTDTTSSNVSNPPANNNTVDGITGNTNDNSVNNTRRFVFQTEQTDSRDSAGKLADPRLFDDSFYESGIERSYTKSLGIVKDNITGLEWQDNAQSLRDLHGNAQNICRDLNLNGTGWRLPEVEELNSITIRGTGGPGSISSVFENLNGNDLYWTNTKAAPFDQNDPKFWAISFFDGVINSMQTNTPRYIRCVRGNPLKVSGDFERISSGEVLDKSTNLVWQDDIDVLKNLSWEDALTQCRKKGRFVQWRTPTIEELYSLVDRLSEEGLSSEFNFVVSDLRCWSSTTAYDGGVIRSGSEAWSIDFAQQNMFADLKFLTNNVTCVRDAN